MKFKREDLWARIGLSYPSYASKFGRDHVLSHQTRNAKLNLLAGLMVRVHFDPETSRELFHLEYQRMLPDGQARNQSIIRIETSVDDKGISHVHEARVQSKIVFKAGDPDEMVLRRNMNRVFQAFSTQTNLVRRKGDIAQSLKLLYQDHLSDVAGGEEIVMRGLDRTGGFSKSSGAYFALASAGNRDSVVITTDHPDKLLNLLGYSRNSFEEDQDYGDDRSVYGISPEAGVSYIAASRISRPTPDEIEIHVSSIPDEIMAHDSAAALPDLAKIRFQKIADNQWLVAGASFMGNPVPPQDVRKTIDVMSFIQGTNQSLAHWSYPPFMDIITELDLNQDVEMFPPVPNDLPYGQWLYGSLHGTGLEKVIDDFGDQIGIASVFLRRVPRADGSISTVGVAVDLPFAAGGPESASDGAIADHSPFMKWIDYFFITHDHFDHCGGAAKLAAAGLMVGKKVVCGTIVERKIVSELDNLEVPKNLRPIFQRPEDIIALYDQDDNRVIMAQSCLNATVHSSYTTPYIFTPCYNDSWYGVPVCVYGDATGFTERGKEFLRTGPRALARMENVTPEKVDMPIGLTLHDVTSWKNEGHAPEEDHFKESLSFVLECVGERAAIIGKFSTNQREDKAILDVLKKCGRSVVTAVGANQQQRMTTMNIAGVLPETNLCDITLDISYATERVRTLYDEYLSAFASGTAEDASSAAPLPDSSSPEEMEKYRTRRKGKFIKQLREDVSGEGIDPDHSTEVFMLRRLIETGHISFAENNTNNYLMYVALCDHERDATKYYGRTSGLAKDARDTPGQLAVLVTGPIGTTDQQFATLPKTVSMTSLLDVDSDVRSTGYAIPAEKRVTIILQPPPIHENEAAQHQLITDLVEKRGQMVFAAHRDGFKIYNSGGAFGDIIDRLRSRGWAYRIEADPRSYAPQAGCLGTIVVTGRSLHIHGHGFREDGKRNVRDIPSALHMAHHIPNQSTYDMFRQDVAELGLKAPEIDKPQDFVFHDLQHGVSKSNVEMTEFAQVNPSYITFNLYRAYGRFYRGFMELTRKTLLRNEGNVHTDPLRARTASDGVYETSLIARDWSAMMNPQISNGTRGQQIRPSSANTLPAPDVPRSRPAYSVHPSALASLLNRDVA